MVPKVSNGTQMVPKMVPKWYPNSLTHFFKWWFFIIFQVQKMATWLLWPQFWVPSQIFGYHRYFFWKTYHVSYLRKKRRPLSRDIYLPSLIFLIFYQIHDFDLWDTLHFLGTIDIFFGKHIMSAAIGKKGGRYLAIFTYLAWFFWFFTRSMIFTCGTLCIFWVP